MVITNTRSNGAYWADGGIISTAEECIIFLKALNEGRIVRADTLKLMHNWHKLQFPIQYGYGTMYFKLPWFINMVMKMPTLWGHSGSTGSFLYYSENLNLYMAGSINQTESKSKPFRLMLRVMKAIQSFKNIGVRSSLVVARKGVAFQGSHTRRLMSPARTSRYLAATDYLEGMSLRRYSGMPEQQPSRTG